MAHAKTEGNGWLEDAFRSLVQAQANLVQAQAAMSQAEATLIQNQASFVTQKAEIDKRIGEMAARQFGSLCPHRVASP